MNTNQSNTDPSHAVSSASVALGIDAASVANLRGARIMLAGIGNIGSQLGLQIAPLVGSIRLVDRDNVEPHNTSNQIYQPQDVGRAKVTVMAEHLAKVAPQVEIETCCADLEDVPWDDFNAVDVCLAGLDSLLSRQVISEKTYTLGIPYIDGAVGDPLLARIQVLLPTSACLECDWSPRHYRQLALERPCSGEPGAGTRTLAPACAGAAVAAVMAAQLIRLYGSTISKQSYEITGDLQAGQFVSSRRRRNPACRFQHGERPPEFCLDLPFVQATVRDVVRLIEHRHGECRVVVEARRGIFATPLFSNNCTADLDTLRALGEVRLATLGLTTRDRLTVRPAGAAVKEHLCLSQSTNPNGRSRCGLPI